jgi:hypothetical protein
MNYNLLIFVGLIYCWVGFGYAQIGRWGMALAFLAYAAANIGFALDTIEGR